MTAPLTMADFEPLLDACFTVRDGVQLRLAEVSPLPNSGRAGGSFRLEFQGPAGFPLPQGIYAFAMNDAAHDIFIVPIAGSADAIHYEAIFF